MSVAEQFFNGLDGEASLVFLGLLACAFLIGLLPAGLTYLVRVRGVQGRLTKHVAAHQRVAQELQLVSGKLEREQVKSREYAERLRTLMAEGTRHQADLQRVNEQAQRAQAEVLELTSERTRQEDHTLGLRNRVATLTAELQTIKSRNRPQAAPTAFDAETLASLKAMRTKAKGLEERVSQLASDNERLRRERATEH